ncbi:hypothetical protein MMC27_000976 [Xylographa pallens]|nr:hypothetical protein [Xylographa pallens]
MPAVKYFLNLQPNGFYSGSVLEGVDVKEDSTVATKKIEDEGVVPTDKQSDDSINIPADISCPAGHNTTLQEDGSLISLVHDRESGPPLGSGTLGPKMSESLKHHILAWNLGQVFLSISKDPCLAAHPSILGYTADKISSAEGSSNSCWNSHILILHYDLERTNIATKAWPRLVAPQIFDAFGVSTNSSINHLIQRLNFRSDVADEQNRPHQLILWSKDNHNEWIPGDVLALDLKNELLTLEDIGWKGAVDNPVRVSLLRWPYCLKYQKDEEMWKVC